jgi:tetratricopeptide (TPR) repeat protein
MMKYKDIGHATEQDIKDLNALEERLQKNPHDVRALIEKGFLCMNEFHWAQEALEAFREAVASDNTNVDAYFWLAKSLYHDHFRDEEAKKTLEIALTLDPDRADCHDLLASVLKSLREDAEKSIMHLQKTIVLEPTWVFPWVALSYYFLKKGDIGQAEKIAIEAYKVYGSTVPPLPTTAMEEYYEFCITGRAGDHTEIFDVLFKKIDEQKKVLYEA